MAHNPSAVGESDDLADAAAFRTAYQKHHGAMVAAAWRVLRDTAAAEDVVQDVFLDLWRSPGSFDPRRGALRGYLTMIAKHRALDRWRSRLVATTAVERARVLAAAESTTGDATDERVIRRETARALRGVIDDLPAPQREAILLAYGSGLTSPEVASVTGAPVGTAKSRLRLGLRAAGRKLALEGAG